MITERLKAETALEHKETEAVSFGHKIMNGSLTRDEYGILLQKNYILHALVESALVSSNQLPSEVNFASRAKTESLQKDLAMLNLPLPSLPSLTITYNNFAEALGAMYVLEGATLGGAYIYKALQHNTAVASTNAFNYYTVYGSEIGSNWKSFQSVLLANVNSSNLEDDCIAVAKKTFILFKEIFAGTVASN